MNYNLLKDYIKKSEHQYKEFADVSQKTESGLRRSIDNQTLTVFTLEKVCELLEVSPSLFFDDTSQLSISGNQNQIGNGNRIILTSPEVKALKQRIKDLEKIIATQEKTIELLTKNK